MGLNRLLLICLVTGLPLLVRAQVPDELARQLQGRKKLADIMQTVQEYYRLHPENNGKKEGTMLHWARWALQMSSRLNRNGEITDLAGRTMEALRESGFPESPSSNPQWYSLGPQTTFYGVHSLRGLARVDRLAFHPTNPAIMYTTSPSGGLYRTVNGGASWQNIAGYLPHLGAGDVVVSHNNPDIIYILTGDADSHLSLLGNGAGFVESFNYARKCQGVWKTTNGGITWQPAAVLDTPGTYVGYQLAQDPANANVLLAATSKGIYRTSNGGASWTRVYDSLTTSVAFQPGAAGGRAFAASPKKIMYSTNKGQNWNTATLGTALDPTINRISMAVSAASSQRVYFLCGRTNYVYRSNDSGSTYTRMGTLNALGASHYNICLTVAPGNADVVNLGGMICAKTVNGGTSLFEVSNYDEYASGMLDLDRYVHPDIHDIAYNPLNGNLYAATDGGVWMSTDQGAAWTDISTGLDAAQIYHITARPNHADTLMCGLQDNGLNIRQGFTNAFRHLAGGDGYSVVLNPQQPGEAWASVNTGIRWLYNGYNNSTFLFNSFTEWFPNVAVSYTSPNLVLVGYRNMYRKTTPGTSFTQVTFNNTIGGNQALIACPSNGNRFYLAGGAEYWSAGSFISRSDDGGATYSAAINSGGELTYSILRPRITAMAVNPANSDQVWVSFGGYDTAYKIFYSPNAGATWINMRDNLPNVPVNCMAVDANNNIYAGTDIGVFYRGNNMNGWVYFSNGLPRVPVTGLLIHAPSSQLTASTFGRGVWRTELYGPCPALLNVNWELRSDHLFEAGVINASSAVNGQGQGTTVVMRAADSIKLLPGFSVKAGDRFRGYTGACGSGALLYKSPQNPLGKNPLPVNLYNNSDMNAVIGSVAAGPHRQAHIQYHLTKAGPMGFIVTDLHRNALLHTQMASAPAGPGEETIPVQALKPGKYYIHVVHNGHITHYQELDLQ